VHYQIARLLAARIAMRSQVTLNHSLVMQNPTVGLFRLWPGEETRWAMVDGVKPKTIEVLKGGKIYQLETGSLESIRAFRDRGRLPAPSNVRALKGNRK
jgi:hypothetical protein